MKTIRKNIISTVRNNFIDISSGRDNIIRNKIEEYLPQETTLEDLLNIEKIIFQYIIELQVDFIRDLETILEDLLPREEVQKE